MLRYTIFLFLFTLPSLSHSLEIKNIVVGVIHQPPFVIKEAPNSYYGVSIDLWQYIATELTINYNYKLYTNTEDVLIDLASNEIDIFLNPLYITHSRMQQFSVSMPYFISNMGIAARPQNSQVYLFFATIFSSNFLQIISFLAFITLFFGGIIWLVERRKNYEHFRSNFQGILDGIWWAAVTITTVGYGDKTPKSTIGKIISVFWMFSAITIISSITAALSSNLNLQIQTIFIDEMKDIKKIEKVGIVQNSSHQQYLQKHGITSLIQFRDCREGFVALEEKKIDIFIYDISIMKYIMKEDELEKHIQILPAIFNKQYFSFFMPLNSPLLKEMNPILIEKLYQDSWRTILRSYNLDY